MIKTLTAYTYEIDDVDAAVAEIFERLDSSSLMKNSVGLINCFAEFIGSGVVSALCEKLPFDTVGCTTLAGACPGQIDQALLTLTVLTSDDVDFSAVMSESLVEEQDGPISEAYNRALKKLKGNPSLILAYAPLINHVGGDKIVDALDKASGDVPIFGTLALDHTQDYHLSETIYNGESSRGSLAFVLIEGAVSPKFYVTSISESKIQKQKTIITSSDGNVVKEVNGIPILKYLEALGIAKDNEIAGANVIPFVIDYNDGTKPIARAIFATTPDGYAVCGGEMPVNSTLAIGAIDRTDVLGTAEAIAKELSHLKTNGVLLFSCMARFLVLGGDYLAEMKTIDAALNGKAAYQICYSGGEICPMINADGKIFNRFHNDTLVVCAF